MGLLQRLLGRRDTPDSVPDPAPENETETTSDNAEPAPRASSGVLADAAPANEEEMTADDELSADSDAEPKPVTSDEMEPTAQASDDDNATDEVERPRMSVVKSGDVSDEDSEAPDGAASSDSVAALVAVSGPAQVGEELPGDESELGEDSGADDAQPVSPGAGFVPERPKRELLTLDKPPVPTEIPSQRTNAPTPEKESLTRPPRDQDLALDTEGSPRPALRSAGVAVPKMQQIARKGPVRLWAFPVKANEALGWWLEIRQVHDRTGWLPVLIGHPAEWRDGGEEIIHEGDDELARSLRINPVELLSQKGSEAGEPPRGVPILPRRGDSDFATPRSDGLLGLVRADHGWEIPSLLPWKGSTNWELYGAEHTSVLRYWSEKFDVELMAMTYDVMELYVANPPQPNDAVKTAEEIYAYCPDLLDSGVPTLDDLAEHMAQSKAWYFRWT